MTDKERIQKAKAKIDMLSEIQEEVYLRLKDELKCSSHLEGYLFDHVFNDFTHPEIRHQDWD